MEKDDELKGNYEVHKKIYTKEMNKDYTIVF